MILYNIIYTNIAQQAVFNNTAITFNKPLTVSTAYLNNTLNCSYLRVNSPITSVNATSPLTFFDIGFSQIYT